MLTSHSSLITNLSSVIAGQKSFQKRSENLDWQNNSEKTQKTISNKI